MVRIANFSYDSCNVCNVVSVGGENLKNIPSLVLMMFPGAAVDDAPVTFFSILASSFCLASERSFGAYDGSVRLWRFGRKSNLGFAHSGTSGLR